MRVNKVDNDTNFKMALRIDVKAQPKLQKASMETIQKFAKLGEKVSKIVFYNVFVNKDLKYEIRTCAPSDKTDYLAKLRKEESFLGKYYEYSGVCGGCDVTSSGYYPDEPEAFRTLYGKKAREQYQRFKKLSTENQLAWYTRILEKNLINNLKIEEAKKAAEKEEFKAAEKAEKQKEAAIDNLMKRYWQSELGTGKTEKDESKKSFFRRMFRIKQIL